MLRQLTKQHSQVFNIVGDLQNIRQHLETSADGRSVASESYTSTRFGGNPTVEVASIADPIVPSLMARGVRMDSNPSLVMGTIAVYDEDVPRPRFVPVRVKYDTGSDANFLPITLLEQHNLMRLRETVPEDPRRLFLKTTPKNMSSWD